jgi:inorganic pyrophosphatase
MTMDFWTRLDGLLDAHEIRIDRPKDSTHPRYPDCVYPLDYGFLADTTGGDGHEIDVWRGSLTSRCLVGVVCTVDSNKGDAEIKLLISCTEDEVRTVDTFHNEDGMSGLVLRRP